MHEPFVLLVAPDASQRPWPHQYEKPTPACARTMAASRAVEVPVPPVEGDDTSVRYAPDDQPVTPLYLML